MTALTTARMVTGSTILETLDAKLAANAVIYKGALCGFKAGYLVRWVSSDTGIKHPCIAIPEQELVIDNTGGSAGDLTCPVKFIEPKHLYRFANDDSPNNIAQANIGGDAFGKDDQTVSASSASGTRSRVGTPWLVITSNTRGYPVGVYVEPESPGADAGVLIGDLTALTTTDKTTVVAAINELQPPVGQILVSRTATVGAKLTMAEGTNNGSNKVTIATPDTLAGDVTLALPTGDLDLGDVPAMQSVDATLVSGTVTISAGIVVAATSEVFVRPKGAITGSTNFGCVQELVASRSVPGTIVIQAVGNDGLIDADAAGVVRVTILTPAG